MNKQYLIKELEAYIPYNEQERVDKEAILKFVKTNDDAFERTNLIGHITSSNWIVNKERTKVLMAYHNIYKSFSWTGGHNDGDTDCINVAIKEAKEETGLNEVIPVSKKIFSVEILWVESHIKRGKYVSNHLHLNVTYLLEADESHSIRAKLDENKEVKWIPIDEIDKYVTEKWMINNIYNKLNEKLKKEIY